MAAKFWKVVGGSDKGGILVRLGQETTSAASNERLSTGAFVKELEIRGERLRYFLLSGDGPKIGWVSTKLQSKDLLVACGTIWEVVGGGAKGGIVVRSGIETTSAEEPDRLSTAALVEELELLDTASGQRLKYQRLTGSGPDTGWVSLKFRNTDLLLEAGRDALNEAEGNGPAEKLVKAAPIEGEALLQLSMSYEDYAKDYFSRLKAGNVVGALDTYPARRAAGEIKAQAPGKVERKSDDPVDADFEARRAVAEANRSAEVVAPKLPPPYVRRTKKELQAKGMQLLDGDLYGIPVPPSLDELSRLGAPWLTKAFLASGALKAGNSVKRIVEFKKLPTDSVDAAGGQGPKALLTVEYEVPDENLITELFVKMPWAADGGPIHLAKKGMDDYPEIAFYQNMGPLVPFKMPVVYFGEICRENTNSIIIMEALKFGKQFEGAQPYTILPLAEKYFDFKLSPPQQCEMYYSLLRAQARLGAWYQLGFFDKVPSMEMTNEPAVGSFHWPTKLDPAMREKKAAGGKVVWGFWNSFLGTDAKRCYPPEFTEEKFYAALKACIEDFVTYNEDIKLYYNLFPEFICLQHWNLNADNAYFWKTANGELDCGLFDFGYALPKNCVSTMTGSLTGAEGEVQFEHDVQWLKCFRDEYYRECGLKLDLGEMRRQWHMSYGIYLIYLGMAINSDIYPQLPAKEWQTITSLWDERAVGKWNVRCYSFMINISLRYLYLAWVKGGKKRLHIHDTLLEWKAYWEKEGFS